MGRDHMTLMLPWHHKRVWHTKVWHRGEGVWHIGKRAKCVDQFLYNSCTESIHSTKVRNTRSGRTSGVHVHV